MDNRRDFIKKAALLSASAGIAQFLPGSVQKAFAIDPEKGSTYLDAEHIVFLMQENRSFDHMYGTLQGVRGFNDPRAIRLANDNKVWLQTNEAGETYAPFRLDINNTNATWMHSLPHSRESQIDAWNEGKYDNWLNAKKSHEPGYAAMPLTMGHYTREDLPFYYALADAFTVCDQHFSSSLTGTTPNRLFFWTGSVRAEQNADSKANVRNQDIDNDYDKTSWHTFPEWLEDNGVSWKVYQNELSIDGGFTEDEDGWLSNFGDNVLEHFAQYNTKLTDRYINYIPAKIALLTTQVKDLQDKLQTIQPTDKTYAHLQKEIKDKNKELEEANADLQTATKAKYEHLTAREKQLHQSALTTNTNDPDHHQLTSLTYMDGTVQREMKVPKGDIFHQFRQDVQGGNLPTVSWLAAPENFSDHPASAWYGAWYVSEALDILTQNPEVWKKTIFILTYDENDGYFDHVPPFVAHHPDKPDTGKASGDIDTSIEYVKLEQEQQEQGLPKANARGGPVGLGYRVPLVIASPWSRGGYVCSEVFEHTSSLQFLEDFIYKKYGKQIKEPNITAWRRMVSGNLSSAFRPYKGETIAQPAFLQKDLFLESIHKAQFKQPPADFKKLSAEEINQVNTNLLAPGLVPQQERGTRPANALRYELYAEGKLSDDKKTFSIELAAANNIFGAQAKGSPFNVYAANNFKQQGIHFRSYAVAPGDKLSDTWAISDFDKGSYLLSVYGPNGFYRAFTGNADDPSIDISCTYERNRLNNKLLTGNIVLKITTADPSMIVIKHNSYSYSIHNVIGGVKHNEVTQLMDLNKSFGWYDFTVKIKGNDTFERKFAGHVETGKESVTDPAMGGV